MANFKVVFRADSDGAERRTGWEPGCPILVKAIQVARDTQTGDAYLQLKVWNLTDQTVGSFALQAEVTYQDGTRETVEANPLDADIAPRHDYKPLPVHLAGGAIADVHARVLEATYGNASWHSAQPAAPLPQGAPLNLEQGLLVERQELLASLGKSADKYATSVLREDAWWVCPCGTPNVERSHCLRCGMPLDTLEKLEDEDYLRGKMRERKQAKERKRRKTILLVLALVLGVLAAAALAVNFLVIQPKAKIDSWPSSYVPSDIAYYPAGQLSDVGYDSPMAISLYTRDEHGNITAIEETEYGKSDYAGEDSARQSQRAYTPYASATTYSGTITSDAVGFPVAIASDRFGGTVDILDKKGDGSGDLPSSAQDSEGNSYSFSYYSSGALMTAAVREADGHLLKASYNEYGFLVGLEGKKYYDTLQCSYTYDAHTATPASCTVHYSALAGGIELNREYSLSFEYDENGCLTKVYRDGVLMQEISYVRIEHTSPWAYATASLKPFAQPSMGEIYPSIGALPLRETQ